jgi:uncharacterized damage-inducible protein DinB
MLPYGSKELAASFRTVRNNTIAAAMDIPADKYDFRPAPDVRTVEKLLAHVALSYGFQHQIHAVEKRTSLDGFDFSAFMAAQFAEEAKPRTKDQVIDLLAKEGEAWATYLDGLSDDVLVERVHFSSVPPSSKTRLEMLMSVKEHEMHHRGQLMLIQRMLGIVPHLTREREARRAQTAERS